MNYLPLILAAATTSAKQKASPFSYVILLVVFGGVYLLFLRPRRQKMRAARMNTPSLEVGASVMSVGGIKGKIVDLDDTDVQVEVAPGVVLTFVRRAVNVVTPPQVDDEWDGGSTDAASPGAEGTGGSEGGTSAASASGTASESAETNEAETGEDRS